MLIDTHAHLYLEEFDHDRDEMLQRALDQGVAKFYLPNIDSTSIGPMLEMERKYPGACFPMMGLHPCSVKENYLEELAIARQWLDRRPFCAIGEIGIDLHWDKTFLDQQMEAFVAQIKWAKEFELPIVIHSRESTGLIIEILEQHQETLTGGIFHCFSGTAAQARQIIKLGFHLGIGGVLTYKNAGLDKVLTDIPISALVLETDSPYLAPAPYRGKRNESSYIRLVAKRLAEVKSIGLEEIVVATTSNAENIFGENTAVSKSVS